MIHPNHLLTEVIRPVLIYLEMHSEAAENLLLGTAIQESLCGTYLKQLENGPALGIYQMEPPTHRSVWLDVLYFNKDLLFLVEDYLGKGIHDACQDSQNKMEGFINEAFGELSGNLFYATAMCRVQYSRFKEPLPKKDDIAGLAGYWKKYYNTENGAGTVEEFIANYQKVLS